jgi:hypothetical protein
MWSVSLSTDASAWHQNCKNSRIASMLLNSPNSADIVTSFHSEGQARQLIIYHIFFSTLLQFPHSADSGTDSNRPTVLHVQSRTLLIYRSLSSPIHVPSHCLCGSRTSLHKYETPHLKSRTLTPLVQSTS